MPVPALSMYGRNPKRKVGGGGSAAVHHCNARAESAMHTLCMTHDGVLNCAT